MYGEILRRAFDIAKGNRHLWFFGLLAGGGGGANFNGNFNFGSGGGSEDFEAAIDYLASHVAVIIGIVVAVVLLIVLFVLLSLIAQGGLARSVAAVDRGEQRSFGSTWRAGLSVLGRMVLLSLLFFLIWLGCLIVIGAPAGLLIWGTIAGTDSTAARVAIIVIVALVALTALVLFLFSFWVVSLLAVRELALADRGPVEAWRASYRLTRRKLGPALLLGLLGLAISFAIGVVLLLVTLLVGVVFVLPVVGLAVGGYTAAAIVVGTLVGLVLLAVFLVVGGAVGTFKHSYWTLGWLRLRAITDWEDAQVAPAAGG